MKLKNKKTGEIGYPYFQNWKEITCVIVDENAIPIAEYTSLTKLNEEWEDYEEPKEHCFISEFGKVYSLKIIPMDKERLEWLKQIGNYFSSREEAEKTVEKLKAWKRLKDKGFRFEGIAGMGNEIYFKANEQFTHIMVDECTADKTEKEYIDDLMLLFRGEE